MNQKRMTKNNKILCKNIDKLNKLTIKMNKKLVKLLEMAQKGKYVGFDLEYSYLCLSSISELVRYTNLITFREYEKAHKHQSKMDSSVRDSIPDKIYKLLEWIVYPPDDKMTIHEVFSIQPLNNKNKISYIGFGKKPSPYSKSEMGQ